MAGETVLHITFTKNAMKFSDMSELEQVDGFKQEFLDSLTRQAPGGYSSNRLVEEEDGAAPR